MLVWQRVRIQPPSFCMPKKFWECQPTRVQDTAGGLGHPTAKRASSCRGESGKVLRKAL